MKKIFLRIAGILVLAFLLWRIIGLVAKGGGSDNRLLSRPAVAVEVDSVRYGQIAEVRQFTGSVYPLYQYVIAPKVSGRIIQINKRIGDLVHKEEIIAKIDDAEYQQAVREAEANLRIAQASLAEAQSQFALAKQELDRVKSLQEKGIASSAELDAALTSYDAQQSRLKLAQAQVEQREASLKSAKIRLSYTVLVASKPGFTGERYVDEGSLLTPSAPIIAVIGIDTVIVRTTVIERDYGRIQVGQSTDVEVDAFPDKRFTGQVARLAPMLQEASRVAQMEIEVINDSLLLKPGMFTRVNVTLNEKDSTQIVPRQAIVSRNGAHGVFMVDASESTAQYFPIQEGIVTSEYTEIISPQLEGLVVTLGQHLLEDGSLVILPDRAEQTDPKSLDSEAAISGEER